MNRGPGSGFRGTAIAHPKASARTRRGAAVALGLLTVALVSCFDQPVVERLHLCFLPDGGYVITVRAKVGSEDTRITNQALARRLQELRADIAAGWQSWEPHFEALAPARERFEVERASGDIIAAVRQAHAREPEGLQRFFALSDVDAFLEERDDWTELTLHPRGSTRATLSERKQVEQKLGAWSEKVSTYLGAVSALYRYLEPRPERARLCLALLFDMNEPGEDKDLPEEEHALLEAASDAMLEVVSVLTVTQGEAYSLDELSRRAFDPFPAPITVTLPASAQEVEGVIVTGERTVAVPELSLWPALGRLADRWVTPDPVTAFMAHGLSETAEGEFPLDAFVALPRRFAAPPPSAREVADALRRELLPASVYRVRWATPAHTATPKRFDWSTLPCASP